MGFVSVFNFDNDPFKKDEGCIYCPGCCSFYSKVEVTYEGCMICCIKCCSSKQLIFMPFETYCCGCQKNLVVETTAAVFAGLFRGYRRYSAGENRSPPLRDELRPSSSAFT
mmetsp:Transcript_506/g.795  ORF Transcript_506/g.795 Transcript_506/m.795 type:complete len:111 (+) Transcript_506:676-1008(+)